MNTHYLTESSLADHLSTIFPGVEFIHNKQVPDSGMKTRPDYRSDELMLIVEFDGNRHFQQAGVQYRDDLKDRVYSSMGYKIVRIPYFIQLDQEIVLSLFGVNVDCNPTRFPQGFIDSSCVLPADFNQTGVKLFETLMNMTFSGVKDEVFLSLTRRLDERLETAKQDRITEAKTIFPESMLYLIQ